MMKFPCSLYHFILKRAIIAQIIILEKEMNSATRNKLKAQAHHLNPVIIIGHNGITQALLDETEIALQVHELIKIKINALTKTDRMEMAESICNALKAEFIQLIGNSGIIYRKKLT